MKFNESAIPQAAHGLAMEYIRHLRESGELPVPADASEEMTYQQYADKYVTAYQGISEQLLQYCQF